MAISLRPPGLPRHLSRLGSDSLRAGETRARVRFLPDGTLVGVASDLRRWSIDQGHHFHLATIAGDTERLGAFCASPDGVVVAVTDEQSGDVVLVRLEDGRELNRLPHDIPPQSLAWSPDGAWIATGGGGEERQVGRIVHIWDAVGGTEEAQLKAHRREVLGIAFSADGSMLAAGGDKTAQIWELRRSSRGGLKRPGKALALKQAEPIWKVLFSETGDALITATAHVVTCWELDGSGERWSIERPGYAQFSCLKWAAGRLLTSFGDTFLLIDAMNGEVLKQWPGIWGGVTDMTVSPGGDLVAATGSFTTRVQLFELGSGRHLPEPPGPSGWMHDIVPSPDGTSAVTCSWDGRALLWELEQGVLRRVFELLDGTRRVRCKAACFLPDGDVVIGYESHLQRWKVGDETPKWERYFAHGWSLSLIAATDDGRAVICCDEASRRSYGHATFYDADSGDVLASRRLYWTMRRAVTSPDRVLLVGAKGAITVDAGSFDFKEETPFHGRWPSMLGALSPEGDLWTARANDVVSDVSKWAVIKTATGEIVRDLDLASEPADMDFGLEGRVLVTAHADSGALRFWDPLAGTLLQEFDLRPIVPHRIRCVGAYVVIAERRGDVVVTKLPDLSYTVPTKPKKIDYITECQRALQAEPGSESWQELCLALDAWKELPDRVLDEASTVLESWSDELRVAPDRWVDEVLAGRRQPRLRLVRTLRYSQIPASGALALARCPDLRALVELDLAVGPIGPDVAEAIASRFTALRALKLYAQRIGDAGAKAIASADWTGLEVLRLGANKIGDGGAVAIVTSPKLSGLKDLSLESNVFPPEAFVAAFTGATHLAGLERVNFSGTKIRGVDVVTEAKHLGQLNSLILGWLELGDADVRRLAAAPHLSGISMLVLKGSRLGLDSIAVLGRATFAAALEVLDVEFTEDAETVSRALSAYPSIAKAYENRLNLDVEELM